MKTDENDLPDDPDLCRLFAFIATSLTGKNARKRTIVADAAYRFTIHTTTQTRILESRTVDVPAGQTLYLHRNQKNDVTNAKAFMVDEEDHSWSVDGVTGFVKYFKSNHFKGRLSRGVHEKMRQDGIGLSLN